MCPSSPSATASEGTPASGVPRSRWAETCAELSHLHRGWLVQILALPANAEPGDVAPMGRTLADGVPLHDVEYEHEGIYPAIVLHTAAPPGSGRATQRLRIANPTALFIDRRTDGLVTGLRIEDATGHSTLIHFRVTAPTEMLDGLADTEL
ncbi:DUF5335 family protein [uncultured Thiohalocapsa sp.]|uniref:DUF5335 family protein n=1 Tax=uncultured Thiohalocapsa sp. TaxID=768990 RepID=UPI0025CB84DA|nr:DUF5335 family protein [uncultured Thiohalocapsa sp.]